MWTRYRNAAAFAVHEVEAARWLANGDALAAIHILELLGKVS